MFLVNKYKQIKAKSDHLTRAEQIRQIQEAEEKEREREREGKEGEEDDDDESSMKFLDLQEIFTE